MMKRYLSKPKEESDEEPEEEQEVIIKKKKPPQPKKKIVYRYEEDDEDSVESGTLSNAAEYDAVAELRKLQPQIAAQMKSC
jgi:hypothetical protein